MWQPLFHFVVRERNTEVDEAELVYDLQKTLGKQIIDVDMLENTMRELDKKGDDQITFAQVESVLHKYSLNVDKMVLTRWMKAARTTGVSSCSILKFIQMLRAATNPIHNINFERGYFT